MDKFLTLLNDTQEIIRSDGYGFESFNSNIEVYESLNINII